MAVCLDDVLDNENSLLELADEICQMGRVDAGHARPLSRAVPEEIDFGIDDPKVLEDINRLYRLGVGWQATGEYPESEIDAVGTDSMRRFARHLYRIGYAVGAASKVRAEDDRLADRLVAASGLPACSGGIVHDLIADGALRGREAVADGSRP